MQERATSRVKSDEALSKRNDIPPPAGLKVFYSKKSNVLPLCTFVSPEISNLMFCAYCQCQGELLMLESESIWLP
jgi:hypothetical protein